MGRSTLFSMDSLAYPQPVDPGVEPADPTLEVEGAWVPHLISVARQWDLRTSSPHHPTSRSRPGRPACGHVVFLMKRDSVTHRMHKAHIWPSVAHALAGDA